MFERVAGELRATLGVDSAAMCARAGDEACGAKARSGRKGRRRAETHTSTQVIAGVEGGGGAWPGFKAQHRATDQRQASPVWRATAGPEGTGGLRDRPLRAKLACGDLAGGRARRRPEHQRCHTATTRGPTASGRAGRAAAGTPAAPQSTPHDRRGSAGFTRPRGGRPRA